MDVSIIETSGLGDRSYLIHDGDVAIAIDQQRDIDRVLDLAREHRVQITHVLETHIHDDYVSGGLELAHTVGADYLVPADADVEFQRRLVEELPDDTPVYPTHGFGSFCSATPSSGDASTIGEQRENNPALLRTRPATSTS